MPFVPFPNFGNNTASTSWGSLLLSISWNVIGPMCFHDSHEVSRNLCG
jgi:hypothetical protein